MRYLLASLLLAAACEGLEPPESCTEAAPYVCNVMIACDRLPQDAFSLCSEYATAICERDGLESFLDAFGECPDEG